MKHIILFVLVLLSGCATHPSYKDFTLLQHGMSKEQVIALLGQPASVEQHGDIEILNFVLPEKSSAGVNVRKDSYYVVFSKERVQSFGRN